MKTLPFSSDDFNWCIENDIQVYGKLDSEGILRIAIRRGGITTSGKDQATINGVRHTSKEVLGSNSYRNMKELSLDLPFVYKQIREKYG